MPCVQKREFSCPVTGVRLQGIGGLPMKDVPIWEKSNLTLEEAAAYSGIGINKLREITNEDKCKFVLWVGNKRLIKRRLFDCFIEQAYSI
jgi:excisionase family DNA binding protein